jgi:hypothetical protein
MTNQEFLTRIWNLEQVDRPGLIVEETEPLVEGKTQATGALAGYALDLTQALRTFRALHQDRDDNVPALSAYLGSYIQATAFGAEEKTFEDGHKYLAGPVIFSPSDIAKMRPLPIASTLLGKQVAVLRHLAENTDNRYLIRCGDIQNPLGVAAMLWDTSDFYISLKEHPQAVHQLLEMITEVTIEYVYQMKTACPKLLPMAWPTIWTPPDRGIYLADDTMALVSPAIYEEFGVQYNNRLSREFGGLMLHSCTTNERYFNSIIKNEGLRSINFAAQYSSDMKKIFQFFGGRVVILPHYVHGDHPQIGTLPEFIEKVLDCWTPQTPTIIYVSPKPEGGLQPEVFDVFERRGFSLSSK